MRREVFNSLLIGVSIAFIALAIHALTDGAAPEYQLLALLLAGTVLFGVQLSVALRQTRRRRSAEDAAERAHDASVLHDRRNPFLRELTRDWIGLDEHRIADQAPTSRTGGAGAESRAPRDTDSDNHA